MKEQIINIPEIIFLQLGFEPEENETVDFKELEGVSWCHENIHGNDIEYTLKSKVDAAMKEMEIFREVVEFMRDYCNPTEPGFFETYANLLMNAEAALDRL